MPRRLRWAVSLIGLVGVAGALRAQAPAGVISTYAGGGKSKDDGVPATDYRLSSPSDVAVDALGNIYIVDSGNHQIVKVDRATQILTIVAGTGKHGYNGDNIPATSATLDNPIGIAFDAAGNLYISDTDNARIRRVSAASGIITTYAGTGVSGFNGDNIQARLAELNDPYHISFDASGNLYIADSSNNRVRKVDTAGIITTVAGTGHGGYNGDNQQAIVAELHNPQGVLVDSSNNLYIADFSNHRIRLVRGGTITTYAGTGSNGTTGDGGPAASAQLKGPDNFGMDAAGNLYIADDQDHKVRQVNTTTLIITTVAGNGDSGYNGDGGPAVDAAISRALSATFDAQGRMYIAGFGSDVVRLVTFTGSPTTITVASGSPQTTRVNTNFAERLTTAVKDSNGNGVSGVTVTFAAPAGGASATLSSPTAITDTEGEAFVFATANSTAGSYSVTATTTGVATPATFSLTNTVSAFVDIAFVQQPSNTTAGVAISPPVTVRVRDLNGNPVGGATVTLGIFASTRSLQGTVTQVTDGSGIATFADLRVETAGSYSLQAATGGAPAVGSASFTVAPAAPSSVTVLAGTGQSTPALTPFADALKARVADAFGNVVPAVAVTFSAPASGPSATFGGAATVNTGPDGIATSPILTANSIAGAFNVTAAAAGASSAAFNLTNLAPVPKTVTFVQQPPSSTAAGSAMTPAIIVQVQDQFQNALPGVQVAMLLRGPSEVLAGTTTRITAANGQATFNDLSITQAGANYQLDAVAISSSAEALSNSFTITGGAPAAISILSGGTQSATILTPYAIPLTVTVEDQFLNLVSGATVVFTAPPSGASGLFGGSTAASVVTNAEGQAAAPITANGTAGAFTVTAGVGAFSVPFQLTNTPGTPGRVVFSQQPPATVTAGATISPPVQVKLEDGSGNGVPNVDVTLTPDSTKRSAPVTATTDADGFATFGTLTINTVAVYVLEAVAGSVSAQSNTVTVTAGPAALMTAFAGSGQTSTVATLFHPLEARVTDTFGNPVSGVSVTFTPPSIGPSVTGIPATAPTGSDGIATSPAITANTVAGTFQVTAAGAGSATFTLTNAPGAGILKFVQQPSNATAGAPMPAIRVQIQDTFNNPVNSPNVPVTLQLSPMPPAATSPTVNTDASGTATFNGFAVSVAGTYTLLAVATGVQSGGSVPFNITAGVAANILAVGGTPESTVVATPFPLPLVAQVTDSFTNPVPNTTITFTVVPSGGAGGTFGGSSTASATTDQQGLAVGPTLTANTTAGTFTVTATVGGKTATWTLTNIAGAVSQITFETQPSTTAAGAPISPPVVVKVVDSHGNPVGGATVVLTGKEGPGSLEGTQTAVTASTGQVTFSDLTLTLSGSYQIEASAVGVLQRSETFQITAKATNLSMQVIDGTTQTASIGTTYALPLQVLVSDEFKNPVPGASVLFTVPAGNGASVTFNGSTTVPTDAAGIATSPTMTANAVIGLVTPVTTTPGAALPAVFALANISGPATQLVFVQQPTNTTAGAAIAPPVTVQLLDALGNPVLEGGVTVTLQLSPAAGGFSTRSAPHTQNTDHDGVATFDDLAIAQAGTYQLQAQSEGLQSATSTSFVIGPAASSSITVVAGNGQSAAVTTNYASQLKASVQDALGNGAPGVAVTFTAPGSGASVTFSGSATVTTDSSGVAAISVTANTQVGSFQVTAAEPGTSTPAVFNLTNVAGSVSHLAFVQQPSSAVAGAVITPPVTVQLTDSIGNSVAQAGVAVTLTANPAAGRSAAIAGTTTVATNASGLATFADLSIATAGSYQFTALGTSLVSAQSSAFTIAAGTPAAIQASGGTPQSTTVLAPFAVPLQVLVTDSAGNPLSGVAVTFSAPATGASATLSSATATTDPSGHASVVASANNLAGSYEVIAVASGLAASAKFSLTNTSLTVPGGQLVFTQQPSNTQAGNIMNPVTVHLANSGGAPVAGVPITLSLENSGVPLGGTLTRTTDSTGQAVFTDLSVRVTGTYRLTANALTVSGLSNSFQITAAASVSIIAVSGTGQTAPVNTTYTFPLKAAVRDTFGNAVPGEPVTFTPPASGPSVVFAGSTSVITDSTGVATSPSMVANSQPGSFQVTAMAPGALSQALFSLTNTAGGTGRLSFVQQPTDTQAGAVMAPVSVQLLDNAGNPVQMAGVPVNLVPISGPPASVFRGTLTKTTDASGLATFTDLSGVTAGTYQLAAQSGSLGSATSTTFRITAGPPAAIRATAGTPQSAAVLTAFVAPLEVTVTDTYGNPISGVSVVFTAPASGASGTFGGASTATITTGAQGIASATLTANGTPGTYVVSAATAAVNGPATFSLTNVATPTRVLAFVQQPGDVPSGQAISPPVTVQVRDSLGAPVNTAGIAISMTLASGTGELSGNIVSVTAANGISTFDDLSIDLAGTKRLRATAIELTPADSNSFTVTAGQASGIAAVGNTPQVTRPFQVFAAPLQALVTDSVGNPVSGVPVTFTVPATGPSGSFSGAPTVNTGADGIATSPVLTANNTAGGFLATATTPTVAGVATFALVILPSTTTVLTLDQQVLTFVSEIDQTPPPPKTVTVSAVSGAAVVAWTASSSAPWLTVSPMSGVTPGQVSVSVNPAGLTAGAYLGSVTFTPLVGEAVVLVVSYTVTPKPTLSVTPGSLVFLTLYQSDGTIPPPSAQTLSTTSSSRPINYQVSTTVTSPPGGTWLNLSAAQGQTPGAVHVSVTPLGLSEGIYRGSVLFQPTEAGIGPVYVPVSLVVGCNQGGCAAPPAEPPVILGIVNSASFHISGAPGAAMTIFGRNLSATTTQALVYPLPTTLGTTMVIVNGAPAPLYYVSPGQINFQMPSSAPLGDARVEVNVGGQQESSFDVQPVMLTAVDPGLYLNGPRAAALNPDLTPHTAATPQAAGTILAFFVTGQGTATPAIPDGSAAPAAPLSILEGTAQATIGGQPAEVTFAGLAPGYAGLAQVNVRIPQGLSPGDHPAFIVINGIPSNAGLISVR